MNLIFFLLSALGIFTSLRWILNPLFSRLFGKSPINQLYDLYLRNLTSIKFEISEQQDRINQGWLYVAVKNAYTLGTPGYSEYKYRTSLEYIRENINNDDIPVDSKVIILRELMKALPKSNKNELQKNLYDLILTELRAFPSQKLDQVIHEFGSKPEFLTPKEFALACSSVSSAWVASALTFIILKDLLVDFQILEISILIVSMILLSFLPLTGIYKSITQLIRYLIAVTAAILFAFGAYASITHRQIEIIDLNLSTDGINQTTVRIQYPTWLTGDDVQDCNHSNKVSVLVTDGTLPPIQFDSSDPEILAMDTRCDPTVARTFKPLTQGDPAYNFHLTLLNPDVLRDKEFSITPKLIPSDAESIELSENSMNIYLEHPVWGFMRHWYLAFFPLILAALASDIWRTIRPEK